jgi:hypothetical protein
VTEIAIKVQHVREKWRKGNERENKILEWRELESIFT